MAGYLQGEYVIAVQTPVIKRGEKHVITDLLNSLSKLFSKKLARCIKVTADMFPLYIID
jgi:hypothetical protein